MPCENKAPKTVLFISNDPDHLETAYGVLLTATIMTICEIAFAYMVAFPGILNRVNKTFEQKNTFQVDSTETIFVSEIKALLKTQEARERILLDKINLHSQVFAAILVTILVLCTMRFRSAVHLCGGELSYKCYMMTMLTVFILLLFQGGFYLMVNKDQRPSFLDSLPSWKFNNSLSFLPEVIDKSCIDVSAVDFSKMTIALANDLKVITNALK